MVYAFQSPVSSDLSRDITNNTLIPYFEALKAGDVTAIKNYISGEIYFRSKKLLEENDYYPEFLRNFYDGMSFEVDEIVESDGDVIAKILVEFPSGSRGIINLLLRKEPLDPYGQDATEIWKVVKEVSR